MIVNLNLIPWDESGLQVIFDYETSGLHRDDGAHPSTLGLKWGPGKHEQLCIPVDQGALDKEGSRPTLFGDASNVHWTEWIDVHRWMVRQHLIAHNAKADIWFAFAGLREGIAPPEHCTSADLSDAYWWDTMVVESLLSPGMRVSLDLIAERYGWNEPYRASDDAMKQWAKKNKLGGVVRYDLAPWDILQPYLEGDLERSWLLYHHQRALVEEGVLPRTLLHRELDLVRVLFRMEQRGLPYKVKESRVAAAAALHEMIVLKHELGFDPSSEAETVKWLQDAGVKLYKTDSGKWQVDQAAITRAINQGVELAEYYQRYMKLQTARSLWYQGWADKAHWDGRVRADYRQVKTWEGRGSNGTVSGRLAVSRVQVQAIPARRAVPDGFPAMQDLIQPERPHVLYEADISQAEMRVVSVLAGCTPMLEGFKQGFDAHDSTTRLIWSIDKDDEDWDARRQVAKRLGFGVIYGAGIRTLADQIKLFTGQDLGEEGVRTLWDQYRAAFPQLFRYSRKVQRMAESNGFIVLPGGKIRAFYPMEPLHKAMNQMIQGGVAAGMAASMVAIETELPGILVGQVHDSVILETASPVRAHRAAQIISETFEDWFPGCPFPTEVKEYSKK